MLKNNTGKRVHINWKGMYYHVNNGDTVDLPEDYAHRWGFDVVASKVAKTDGVIVTKPNKKVFDDADVNKDGKVDIKDFVAVAKKIIKKVIKPKKK